MRVHPIELAGLRLAGCIRWARAVPEERQCGPREYLVGPTGEIVLRSVGQAAHVELEVFGGLFSWRAKIGRFTQVVGVRERLLWLVEAHID